MRSFWALTRVLLRNARNPIASGRRRGLKRSLFGVLIAAAFVPIMIQIGILADRLLRGLAPLGQEAVVLAFGLSSACVLVFTFGVLSAVVVYYLAQDVEFLLALPLGPSKIMAAKFVTTVVYEYAALSLFLLPLFVVYGRHAHAGPAFLAAALAVFLVLPLIPVALASVPVMVVMLYTDLSRNRDRFGRIAGTLLLVFVLGLNYAMQRATLGGRDAEALVRGLAEGRGLWRFFVHGLFPAVGPAVSAVTGAGSARGWVSLGVFLAANAAAVRGFLWIGERLYFRGVLGRPRAASGRAVAAGGLDLSRAATASSAVRTYLLKELRILFRDPVFFLNCILMNFLWPVFLVFFGLTGADSGGAGPALAFSGLYGQAGFHAVLAGAGMLVTALNAIASSAVSREGKHLAFAKALPLSPGRQLLVKAGAAAVMGGVGCAVLAATALTVFRMPAVHLPALALLAPLGIAYAALSGVLLDVHFPKLHWDNAYKAVKQNVNVPLHMAFCALTAAGAFWLARRVPGPPVRALQVLASLLLLLDAVLFRLVKTAGARALEKIEV